MAKAELRPLPDWIKKLLTGGRYALLKTGTLEVLYLFTLLNTRYWPNRNAVHPDELLLPILLFAPLLLLTFKLYYLVFKNSLTAHLASFCMLYVFYHFGYHFTHSSDLAIALSPFKSGSEFTTAIGIVGLKLVVSGGLAFLAASVLKFLKIHKLLPLMKVFAFVVVFIFVSQLYKTVDYALRISDQTSFDYQLPDYKKDREVAEKPDIYYFVFDRYTSDKFLRDEYGFDNSDMTEFLKGQGFTVKDQALSNYPFTITSVASTLAMEYHDEAMGTFKGKLTEFPLKSILDNPPVVQLLRKDGYAYYQIGSWWGPTSDKVHADFNLTSKGKLNILGKKFNLTEFQELFDDVSASGYLYPPVIDVGDGKLFGIENVDVNERQRPLDQIDSLKSVVSNDSKAPKFVFTHVLSPHSPYLFDENGDVPVYDRNSNDDGVDEMVKYVAQLKYVNKLVKDAISTIRAKSPGAIVILQADEGPYPKEFRGKTLDHLKTVEWLPDTALYSKYAIQAAYFFPNKSSASKINSSVDAFRVTLSDYLGYDIPSLPSCQYSGRTLVNTRLGAPLSPDCPIFDGTTSTPVKPAF